MRGMKWDRCLFNGAPLLCNVCLRPFKSQIWRFLRHHSLYKENWNYCLFLMGFFPNWHKHYFCLLFRRDAPPLQSSICKLYIFILLSPLCAFWLWVSITFFLSFFSNEEINLCISKNIPDFLVWSLSLFLFLTSHPLYIIHQTFCVM